MTGSITRSVPFNALAPGVAAIRSEIDAAIDRVLTRGWFILGPEVQHFEAAFAAYHGPDRRVIGVGSGTDALRLALEAMGVGPGDEVLTVANAGVPPVAAIVATGARPVFCDVDPASQALDPREIQRRATSRTRAVLVVHLFGQPAAMHEIVAAAQALELRVLEDCAQAHGARLQGQLVGTFGDAAAFSFYPTKNLGALGDGGAVLTADPGIADRVRLLRQYGWRHKYVSEMQGTVSRLDELQAAILTVKLRHLDEWNSVRRALAERYTALLAGLPAVRLPAISEAAEPVFHLYVVRLPADRRAAIRAVLTEKGVGTDVHYPRPVHLQAPYLPYGGGAGSLPRTELLAQEVCSLPLYPELPKDDQAHVVAALRAAL